MSEHVCDECQTAHTSAAAMMHCCDETDRHGRPKYRRGDDYLP